MKGLTARLLIFNLLLAVFPVGAFLFLGTHERQLLESQERAMVQQGRLFASALTGENLEEEAQSVLIRMSSRNDSRMRVVDANGHLLADSATTEIQANSPPLSDETAESYPQENVIYQMGAIPARILRRLIGFVRPPQVPREEAEYYIGRNTLDGPEIKAALDGRYGAETRISEGQVSVTLYSAIPIVRQDSIIGAVLVSRSTFAILSNLYQLRLNIMIIFLLSIGIAIILSLLLARTVTVPVSRLRNQAEELLDERGKLQAKFKPLSGKDEVADLSRALHRLSSRLYERTNHLEDFISDLVHEMKNPVACILSASELAEQTVQGETKRFLSVINNETRRIQRLLDDLRELISVDIRLDKGYLETVDVGGMIQNLIEAYPPQRRGSTTVEYIGQLDKSVFININPDRFAQAVLNLVDNAVSFSPRDGRVTLGVGANSNLVTISVADQGPGVPEDESEKIFNRWYTDRPESEAAKHTGLGLAIVQGIATGYDGQVYVTNAPDGGAVFTLSFPRRIK